MSFNYTLRYRTFDQLVNEASLDFEKYELDGSIQPQQLIAVTRYVNYDLGLRISQTKEAVLEVTKGRVKLPDNFNVLNFALVCGDFETKIYMPQGTHVEERIVDPITYRPIGPEVIPLCEPGVVNPNTQGQTCSSCSSAPCSCQSTLSIPNSCQLNCKGEQYELIQYLSYQTRVYKFLKPIKLLQNAMEIDCDCPNLYWDSPFSGWIRDGWLYTNFQEGKVYINYQGMMEDDNGNLLVPDHDLLNQYYEYAIKQRILENLIMNDETVSPAKVQMIEARHDKFRKAAKSFVNTPNFAELRKIVDANRKAMYHKYYDMFKSYPWTRGHYNASFNGTHKY
jgi:hypothetical protein